MATMNDVPVNELLSKLAEKLKAIEHMKAPEWARFVKTGSHKERPPTDQDWWYMRAASILRTVYRIGPIGVSKLRTKYGGKKNRGHKTEHFRRASGSILRHALQQLEKSGLIKQVEKGIHKGRIMTAQGKSFVDKTASELYKAPKRRSEVKEALSQPAAETKKQ